MPDRALLDEIGRWLDEVWFPPHSVQGRGISGGRYLLTTHAADDDRPHLDESLRRLRARWPGEELGATAARLYYDPVSWQPEWEARHPLRRVRFIVAILEAAMILHRRPGEVPLIERRLRFIFEHAYDEDAQSGIRSYPPSHRQPDVEECLKALDELPPDRDSLRLTEQVVSGALDARPIAPPGQSWGYGLRAYEVFHHPLVRGAPAMWQRLFDAGRFTPQTFESAVRCLPNVLSSVTDTGLADGRQGWFVKRLSPALRELIAGAADAMAAAAAEDLRPETSHVLVHHRGLRGPRFLVAAVRQHGAHGLGPLVYEGRSYENGVFSAVLHMARARDVEPADPAARARLVAELQALPAASLEAVLPVALAGRRLVLDALHWERAGPLVEAVVGLARLEQATMFFSGDVKNSPDPTEGVADVAAFDSALAAVGEDVARRILEGYRKARVGAENAVYLLQAAAGWNRAAVEAGLAKENQLSIKAYGLLPLDPAPAADEVLERYLKLKELARQARKFGAQRKANQQAAADAGLTNLAQRAGYAGAVRLEWAMEARIGEEVAPVGRSWTLGVYEAELRLAPQSGTPELEVRKSGAALKSVPATLRKDRQYVEIQDTLTRLREQAARIKDALEEYLTLGEALTPADLEALLRLPLARSLLERLVLQTEDGGFTLIEPGAEPPPGAVRIAHPFHLFQAGQLAAWQQRIVQQRLVQPFKQAFRELYLLTPVERESGNASTRFSGHTLNPRVASRLLQARNWLVESLDRALPYKLFPQAGLEAVFDFPDAGHYLAETETITSDRIFFLPRERKSPWRDWQAGIAVPLEQVPPLVFSEVMRDADLVVSVAQLAGERPLSEEAYQRRGELVRTLVDDLRLSGVRIEGHFAYVEGKLARYRVHLASAAIQIAPGYGLCIVPDRWGRSHERLFLPFVDEGDARVSEAISKVLLLLEDDKIKDPSIRQQILHAGGR